MMTVTNNHTLYQAMRAYTESAMSVLRSACSDTEPSVLGGVDEWQRESGGVFRLYDREEPPWFWCLSWKSHELHRLKEYEAVVQALRDTPYAAELMDQLVGASGSLRRIETDHIADNVIWTMAGADGLVFSEEGFATAFSKFVEKFSRRRVSFAWEAPLLGMVLECAPLGLGRGLEITKLTDAEIARCLSIGFLPHPNSIASRMRHDVTSVFAVRLIHDEPLQIGERSEQTARANDDSSMKSRTLAVVSALRVFKTGRVSIAGVLHRGLDWPVDAGTSYSFTNPGTMPWFNKYTLNATEAQEFQEFWSKVEDAEKVGGSLANAIRRFSYAQERERHDDALVDYMVAAESLFLHDMNDDRGEMRYRLSHRAALFIDSSEYSRRAIFQFMKRAYDARSAIVHGAGMPDPKTLKLPTGEPANLETFTKTVESLMRRALKKALSLSERGDLITDWDAETFA